MFGLFEICQINFSFRDGIWWAVLCCRAIRFKRWDEVRRTFIRVVKEGALFYKDEQNVDELTSERYLSHITGNDVYLMQSEREQKISENIVSHKFEIFYTFLYEVWKLLEMNFRDSCHVFFFFWKSHSPIFIHFKK